MITKRVPRGGSWFEGERSVRCAIRFIYAPAHCCECFGLRPVAKANPSHLRIVRGGFWLHGAEAVRCAHRLYGFGTHRASSIGFRPVAKATS